MVSDVTAPRYALSFTSGTCLPGKRLVPRRSIWKVETGLRFVIAIGSSSRCSHSDRSNSAASAERNPWPCPACLAGASR